jgi:hypothetical protein
MPTYHKCLAIVGTSYKASEHPELAHIMLEGEVYKTDNQCTNDPLTGSLFCAAHRNCEEFEYNPSVIKIEGQLGQSLWNKFFEQMGRKKRLIGPVLFGEKKEEKEETLGRSVEAGKKARENRKKVATSAPKAALMTVRNASVFEMYFSLRQEGWYPWQLVADWREEEFRDPKTGAKETKRIYFVRISLARKGYRIGELVLTEELRDMFADLMARTYTVKFFQNPGFYTSFTDNPHEPNPYCRWDDFQCRFGRDPENEISPEKLAEARRAILERTRGNYYRGFNADVRALARDEVSLKRIIDRAFAENSGLATAPVRPIEVSVVEKKVKKLRYEDGFLFIDSLREDADEDVAEDDENEPATATLGESARGNI